MKRFDRVTILLSPDDKERLEEYGSVTLYENDEPVIEVRYDN